jgi:hypothetical protein
LPHPCEALPLSSCGEGKKGKAVFRYPESFFRGVFLSVHIDENANLYVLLSLRGGKETEDRCHPLSWKKPRVLGNLSNAGLFVSDLLLFSLKIPWGDFKERLCVS